MEEKNEIADLIKSMGEDASKEPETVKAVKKASRKPRKKPEVKKEEPAPQEQPKPVPDDQREYVASFEAEPLFDDEPKHDAPVQFLMDGEMVKVTDDDKSLYIKAVLNDTPLQLTIEFANKINVTCRALTPYERNLVPYAVQKHFELIGSSRVGTAFLADYARQYMMSMQVVAVGTKQERHLTFNSKEGTQEEHVLKLATEGKAICDNFNMAKYSLLIKALNIFENKLARLNTAALKQDFWDPADAG